MQEISFRKWVTKQYKDLFWDTDTLRNTQHLSDIIISDIEFEMRDIRMASTRF